MISKSDQKKVLFKCDVTGLTGIYVGQKEAESIDSNKNLRQIVYIPLQDLNEGMINRWKGVKDYTNLWEVTNTKYPKNAIIGPKPVPESNREEGLFGMQVVATQNHNGKNSFRESFVDDDLEHRVDRLESQLESAQKESAIKDIENLDTEDEDDDMKRDERGRPSEELREENLMRR